MVPVAEAQVAAAPVAAAPVAAATVVAAPVARENGPIGAIPTHTASHVATSYDEAMTETTATMEEGTPIT